MNDLELIAALPEHELVLANLLELYIHDFSEFLDLELGEDGRFGYASLRLYWSEPGRYPFLIRMDGRWAGLIFVRRGSVLSGDATVWDMAEFFILRGCRRHGVGSRAAVEIWKRFPGRWEVRVMDGNLPALRFWASAISEFEGRRVSPSEHVIDGKNWNVFSFDSLAK